MDPTTIAAIIGVVGAILAAVVAGILALLKRDKPSQSANASDSSCAISAGRDIHIEKFVGQQSSRSSKLEITDVSFTHDSEFDIKVRNLGDDAIIIHQISILLVKNYDIFLLPGLEPTAIYRIPVHGLKEGQSRSLDVSHAIDGHKADRFLIALDTTRVYRLRVTLHYNRDESASFEMDTWDLEGKSLYIEC